jgi:hypothetical protein
LPGSQPNQRRAKPPNGVKFSKELKEPIFINTTTGLGLWGTKPLKRSEIAKNISEKVERRLEEFLRHYGIPLDSPHRFKKLSCSLLRDFGLLSLTFEGEKRPRAGAPRVWSTEGTALVKRMNQIIQEKGSRPEAAARELKKKFPEDYRDLTAKSLSNRFSELKTQYGMRLDASPAEYRRAAGAEIKRLRAQIRSLQSARTAGGADTRKHSKADLKALISREKYYVGALRNMEALEN